MKSSNDLKTEYPDADCTLDYDQAWKLSGKRPAGSAVYGCKGQCGRSKIVFAKYPGVEALADADVAEIEAIVRPCGLGKSKARDISACMKMLRDEFDGKVPKDFNALAETSGCGTQKCQSDHGRCVRVSPPS